MTNVTVNTSTTVETVETEVETTVDMVVEPVREAVAREIRIILDDIGTSYIKVGSLLNEARADFEAQKDFLAWAELEFSIKKAQCYNLMNVARSFDGNEAFKGVAMRVMLALVPHADEATIMEQAAALALDGKLDTAAVNNLTGKPLKAAVDKATLAGIAQAQAAQKDADGAQGAPNTDSTALGLQTYAEVVKADALANVSTADNARSEALLATIKGLNDTIAELQSKLNERTSERETRKSAAPMLPQFKSKCLYARLGLSAEESEKKAAVNKAKRELVKLGYGEGHEAWAFINEAVEALTK